MSITSQAVSSRSTVSRATSSSTVSAQDSSLQGRSVRYSTSTDIPNFAGYHPSPETDVSRKQNPIAEFIPDDLYNLLRNYDLINEKALRDFMIRRDYRQVRKELHLSRADAIEYLQTNYPYLQVDTIRKIVYRVNSNLDKKRML